VRYDREWLDRLLAGVTVVGRVGLALSAILALGAALTVTTVVRLALHAKRDELEIMELVGSPRAFVQGPFIMEGTLQGAIGGVWGVGVLLAVFWGARARYLMPWASALNLSSVSFVPAAACLFLVLGATVVGCFSGFVAAKTRT
jgi:cell division transport system permease protein